MKKLLLLLAAAVGISVSSYATDYYLTGGFNNWTLQDSSCKFTETSTTGVYELKYSGKLTSGFKINDGTWDNADYNIGGDGSTTLVPGTAYTYTASKSSKDITMSYTVQDPTITLDTNATTITVTGEKAEVEIGYQLWGNFDSGSNWYGNEFKKNSDDEWVAYQECSGSGGEFGIKELADGAQTSWYAAASSGVVIGGASTDITITNTDCSNFTIYPCSAGGYTFTLHPQSLTLDVAEGDTTSGIADIEADDNAAPIYYNLQGVRIANPENGLFIEVRGNKAVKVIK